MKNFIKKINNDENNDSVNSESFCEESFSSLSVINSSDDLNDSFKNKKSENLITGFLSTPNKRFNQRGLRKSSIAAQRRFLIDSSSEIEEIKFPARRSGKKESLVNIFENLDTKKNKEYERHSIDNKSKMHKSFKKENSSFSNYNDSCKKEIAILKFPPRRSILNQNNANSRSKVFDKSSSEIEEYKNRLKNKKEIEKDKKNKTIQNNFNFPPRRTIVQNLNNSRRKFINDSSNSEIFEKEFQIFNEKASSETFKINFPKRRSTNFKNIDLPNNEESFESDKTAIKFPKRRKSNSILYRFDLESETDESN